MPKSTALKVAPPPANFREWESLYGKTPSGQWMADAIGLTEDQRKRLDQHLRAKSSPSQESV